MKKKKFIKVAREVIDFEIKALVKLKRSINNSFNLDNAFISRSITSFATLINFFFFI